jgi:hypothetical protein
MEQTAMSRIAVIALCALFLALLSGCSYPVDTSGRDLPELESVWQYLETYSIWQDRIPQESNALQSFQTPEALLSSIDDTLHAFNYTTYDSTHLPNSGPVAAAAAVAPDTTVYWYRITPSTALLKITEFKQDTTYTAFLGALPYLALYANIIVDLRDNGGGDIKAVDSIMEYFLPVNTPYIQATYRRYNETARTAETVPWEQWATKHEHFSSLAGKHLAVLVNGGSASASEILTAGLKDGRAGGDTAVLVGETTYGKGMGQVIISRVFLGKRDLKITFLLLKGISSRTGDYHRKGITPDVPVNCTSLERSIDSLDRLLAFLPGLKTQRDNLQWLCDSMNISAALHVLEPLAVLPKTAVQISSPQPSYPGAYVRVPATPLFEK